jgi:ferredoxin-like protein FixX
MGYAFSEAVAEILDGGGDFGQEALEKTYVRRVEESSYMADVRHLKDWPEFVSSAREFFGRQVEVVAGTSHVLTSEPGLLRRHLLACRLAFETLTPARLPGFLGESLRAMRALGLTKGLLRDLPVLLAWWTINVIAGFVPRPTRTNARLVPLLLHDGKTPRRAIPLFPRFMRWRLGPGLAEALHYLYLNDGTPLPRKVRAMRMALLSRLALWDFVLVPTVLLLSYLLGALSAGWFRMTVLVRRMPLKQILETPFFKLREESRRLTDLGRTSQTVDHDRKLAFITYESDERTHIHFHAAYDKKGLPDNSSPLFHICPARVYQEEVDQSLSTSVAVLHENCIRCETCWRADDAHVDWGRKRGQKLVFEAYSPASVWLAESQEAAARADLGRPSTGTTRTGSPAPEIPRTDLPEETAVAARHALDDVVSHARAFLAFNRSLGSVLPGADQWLLADLGRAVFDGIGALLTALGEEDDVLRVRVEALRSWRDLAAPRLTARRFFHFETDLELLLAHHLPDLQARTGIEIPQETEQVDESVAARRACAARLDAQLERNLIAECEERLAPTEAARALLQRRPMATTFETCCWRSSPTARLPWRLRSPGTWPPATSWRSPRGRTTESPRTGSQCSVCWRRASSATPTEGSRAAREACC